MRFLVRWLACLPALVGVVVHLSAAAAQVRTQQRKAPTDQTEAAAPDAPTQRAAPRTASNTGAERKGAAAQRMPQGPVAPQQNLGPKAPFTLTEAEQRLLDQILVKWEQQSTKIKTFKCDFTSWEYDPTFGDPNKDNLKAESTGYIKYKSPDRGEYTVSKVLEFDFNKGTWQPRTDNLDRWMCDGQAIFEFNAKKKQVVKRRLPPELQGKAISDGPLPFVFGAKADQLRRRYWMRDVTPKDKIGKAIWLEAWPIYQQDAANFERATVILSEPDFMPQALQITLPGSEAARRRDMTKADSSMRQGANTAYGFANQRSMIRLGYLIFSRRAPRSAGGRSRKRPARHQSLLHLLRGRLARLSAPPRPQSASDCRDWSPAKSDQAIVARRRRRQV